MSDPIDAQKKINLDNINSLRDAIYPKALISLGEGYYDAIVTRCIDKKNKGWIKVSVIGITGDLPLKDQPWAEPAPSQTLQIPKAGTQVFVTFRDGDVHCPVWHTPGIDNTGKFYPHEINDDYPHTNILYKSNDGTILKDNIKSGECTFSHSSGTSITFQKDGSFVIVKDGDTLSMPHKCVTDAAFCPYLTSLGSGTPVAHPTGAGPVLQVGDRLI